MGYNAYMHNMRFTYQGGPLDGVEKTRTTRGRWADFHNKEGKPIQAHSGKRQLGSGRGVYKHHVRVDLSIYPHVTHHTYVWVSREVSPEDH